MIICKLYIYKNNQCVLPYLGNKKYECIYGDICSSENIKHALKVLDWSPKRTIQDACLDGWKWQMNKNNFSQ